MKQDYITTLGITLNVMADHNDIEGIKSVMSNSGYTLDEIHQKCPFLDIAFLLGLRATGDL